LIIHKITEFINTILRNKFTILRNDVLLYPESWYVIIFKQMLQGFQGYLLLLGSEAEDAGTDVNLRP